MEREYVEALLLKMGMSPKLKGFRYTTEAVVLLDTPDWNGIKWSILYYKIGKLHGDTASNVERSIRTALKSVRQVDNNRFMVERYIGFNKTSNSDSITRLYKIVHLEKMQRAHLLSMSNFRS